MSRFIDLSHLIEDGMITYKGLPPPRLSDYLGRVESRSHYAPGTEFHIARIEMVANTGTYVDAPFHRYQAGLDVSQLDLASLADLDAVVVRAVARTGRSIGRSYLESLEVAGKAVLVHTGWDRHWRAEQYFEEHPFLAEGAARFLVESRARLVGIDSYNIDDTADTRRPVHSLLLGAGIPVVEHLCHLEQLPDRGARFFAVPPPVVKMGSFPIRAFAIVAS